MKLLILGNPENRRVTGFVEAWRSASSDPVGVCSWEEFLSAPESCERALAEADLVRIESPGENWTVERLLLARGAEAAEQEGIPDLLSARQAMDLKEERGRIHPMRQWFHGWCSALEALGSVLRRTGVRATILPSTVITLFDKEACHEHLRRWGVEVPTLVGVQPADLDEVWACMDSARCARVFVKPRHGSSASGVIALSRHRGALVATTSIVRNGDGFYNSLRVRKYESVSEIRRLVDFVCRQSAIVERWLPKCGFRGRTVDLRAVTTMGVGTHFVLRTSRGPLTNLHLGNERGDLPAFQEELGGRWVSLCATCEAVAASFTDALHLGIDLLVSPGFRRVTVAEVNAFGDLLPGIRDREGRSTYEAQVSALRHQVSTTGR